MMEIAVAKGDDWKGVYIDGELVYQNHSIDWDKVFKKIVGSKVESFDSKYVDFNWLMNRGTLPDSIDEVEWS